MTTIYAPPQVCECCTKRLVDEWVRCLCGKKLCGLACLKAHAPAHGSGAYVQYVPEFAPKRTLNAFVCIAIVGIIGAIVMCLMFWPVAEWGTR
jgi:hypothetical protein